MTLEQKVRDEMRKHDLTQVYHNLFTGGHWKDDKLHVVKVALPPHPTDEEIAAACAEAAKRYNAEAK